MKRRENIMGGVLVSSIHIHIEYLICIYIYIPTGSLKTVGQNDILFFCTYIGETTLCRAFGDEP